MTRLIPAALILVVAAALAILAWPQLFGLAWTTPVAQVVSLRGLGVAVALLVALVFTLLALLAAPVRRFAASIAVLLLVFAAVNAAVLSTRGFGSLAFDTPGDNDVTVLSWNTLGDAPGAQAIADLALENGVEILALPETSNELGVEIADLMGAADKPMYVYTVAYDQVAKARSTTLLVSVDLGEYSVDNAAITTSVLPSVVATPVDGSGPTLIAVHALAPVPPMLDGWMDDLRWTAAACTGDNVIMAGDFNATLDHFATFDHADGATLGDCADAALATGNAAVGTWPTAVPALLGAPIDHILATPNWTVSGMRVVESQDDSGSDHRPVLAQFSPAG